MHRSPYAPRQTTAKRGNATQEATKGPAGVRRHALTSLAVDHAGDTRRAPCMVTDPHRGAIRLIGRGRDANRSRESLTVPRDFSMVPISGSVCRRRDERVQVRGVGLMVLEVLVLGQRDLAKAGADGL